MHPKTRLVLAALLMASVATTASADPGTGGQNDAGSGGDAGDTRAAATAVSLATLYGGGLRPNDVDWYAASVGAVGPSCVVARVHASTVTHFALGAESSGETLTAPFTVAANGEGYAGVADVTPLTATLRVRQANGSTNFGQYDFHLDRVGVPSSGGDRGGTSDAGDSIGTALAASPGCTTGRLAGLDLRDLYTITVPAGHVVTYSLAANAPGVALTLLDKLGTAIGPTLESGEAASVVTPTSGTYYMSASRDSSAQDFGYAIGAIVGPEPTSCRPYCLG